MDATALAWAEGLASWIRATWKPIASQVPEAKREDFS